jgi:hypothetical protein
MARRKSGINQYMIFVVVVVVVIRLKAEFELLCKARCIKHVVINLSDLYYNK